MMFYHELRQGSLAEIEALKKKATENKELLVWRDSRMKSTRSYPSIGMIDRIPSGNPQFVDELTSIDRM